MDDSLITEKLKDIGLEVKSIEFLDKGSSWWTRKYIIKTESEKYVLKIHTIDQGNEGWGTTKIIQEQMNIMRKINEKEIVSIYPIHDKPLIFEKKIGYVYKFVEGMPLAKLLNTKSCKT